MARICQCQIARKIYLSFWQIFFSFFLSVFSIWLRNKKYYYYYYIYAVVIERNINLTAMGTVTASLTSK